MAILARKNTPARGNTPLGDLVAAAFDNASLLSADPREISRLAAQAIARDVVKEWAKVATLRRAGRAGTAAAWTRLFFQYAQPPRGLLARVAVALGRVAVGGRASW